jgi:putative ABC transport system permease protein
VKFLDQHLEELYQEEFRFMRQVLVFSVICLIITLIGVFCMTMFETEYRRKEIGIRKIMGSTSGQVINLLLSHYLWLTLAAFLVAAPVAYAIGSRWLQNFTERTPIHWWLFPLAFVGVGAVTLGTVALQSWRAANANPIDSIKSE